MKKEHRWKLSWPGNCCLDCGEPDPLEDPDILQDCDCEKGCEKCAWTGVKPGPVRDPGECPG